ncbi:phage baseplate protein [Xenorhabdus stockiae]|uniref:phage baseplate protein n=1 Tax=Xenorhabdus stockiae TaxID=351614 RepID=UPI004063BEC7
MFGKPDIPNWKGIPNAAIDAGISLGGAALINTLFGNYWGIFNQYGIPLLLADSVISLQYQNQYRVVSAPIENGSFASYNKVGEPYKVTVQLSKSSGGTLERGAFLSQLEILAKSTLKFHVVTPEFVYINAAIVGYDLAREAKDGTTLIKVNVHLEEVREVKVKYDKEEVKNPDDAKKKDTGDQTQKVEAQQRRVEKGDKSWGKYFRKEPWSAFNSSIEESYKYADQLTGGKIQELNRWIFGDFPQ